MRTTMLAAMAMAMAFPAAAQMKAGDPAPAMPSAPASASASASAATGGCLAGTGPAVAEDGTLALARPARFALGRSARFAVPPGRTPAADSFGGTLSFDAPATGRYRLGLAPGLWVDVVKDGTSLASIAHGHDGGCKTVDFQLAAGRYRVQLSGGRSASVDVVMTGIG